MSRLKDFNQVVQGLNDQLLSQVSGISQSILTAPHTGHQTLSTSQLAQAREPELRGVTRPGDTSHGGFNTVGLETLKSRTSSHLGPEQRESAFMTQETVSAPVHEQRILERQPPTAASP